MRLVSRRGSDARSRERYRQGPVDGWQREILRAVMVRPPLWPVALRQAVRMAPPGWWRRPPFFPVPDAAYLRFRLQTAYGSEGRPTAEDVISYLRWCRDFPGGEWSGSRRRSR